MVSGRPLNIGIFNTEFAQYGGGERTSVLLADHWSQRHRVTVISNEPIARDELGDYFGVDLSRIETCALAEHVPAGTDPVTATHVRWNAMRDLDLDVFVNQSYGSTVVNPARHGMYICMFPHWLGDEPDLFARPTSDAADPIASYGTIIANSQFTARHVRQRWSRDPVVTYSPCQSVRPQAKDRTILHVARFQPMKRQDALIAAFRDADVLHGLGYELHLAGSTSSSPAIRDYVNQLRSAAEGLPVVFHENCSRATLDDLFGRAAMYWHATGYGTDPDAQPELQEHFGQTTVEALSAGAVPVVINRGGQCETVEHGVSGFRWDTLDELIEHSTALATHPTLRSAMSAHAIAAAEQFRLDAYLARMDQLLATLAETRRGALLGSADLEFAAPPR